MFNDLDIGGGALVRCLEGWPRWDSSDVFLEGAPGKGAFSPPRSGTHAVSTTSPCHADPAVLTRIALLTCCLLGFPTEEQLLPQCPVRIGAQATQEHGRYVAPV